MNSKPEELEGTEIELSVVRTDYRFSKSGNVESQDLNWTRSDECKIHLSSVEKYFSPLSSTSKA